MREKTKSQPLLFREIGKVQETGPPPLTGGFSSTSKMPKSSSARFALIIFGFGLID